MSNFNMHRIKRQARKEAWYGDSYNPFRRRDARSNTWSGQDLEAYSSSYGAEEPLEQAARVESSPPSIHQSGHLDDPPETNEARLSSEDGDKHIRTHVFHPIDPNQKKPGPGTETAWELDGTELSWDPFGCLSEELSQPGYVHPAVRFLHNKRMVRKKSDAKLHDKSMDFKTAGKSITTTQIMGSQDIDVHLLELTATGTQPVVPIYDLVDLSKLSAAESIEGPAARLLVVEEVSPTMIKVLSGAFGCGVEVFNDHLRRAGEDVALVLPSVSRRQSHVIIPYRRTYQPSLRKEIRETRNLRSSFSHGGLVTTEEHITLWVSPVVNGSWTGLILCDPDPIQSGNRSSNEECMRTRFEAAMKSSSASELLHDPFSLVRVLLQLVSENWAAVIRDQEGYMLPGLKPQYTGATDLRLSEKESFGEYLKQTVGMLKMDLQIFQTMKSKTPSFTRDQDELVMDYEFLLHKALAQIEQNTSSIPVITAMIAVEDNRKAIQQANDVKALTTLATIYIPLSFIAGIFGMNVTQLNPNPLVNIPLWLYFAIALPITAASMLLVWHWTWLLGLFVFILQKLRHPKQLWSFDKKRNIKESPLANALANTGVVSIFAGPGKPAVNHGNFVQHHS